MPDYPWPNVVAMLLERAERRGDVPFLWAKRDGAWRPTTWRQAADAACRLAAGLRARGLARGERVVLVAENRPEWLIADFAIMAAGGITVPAYTTNTVNDHAHILGDSGAAAAIVSTPKLAQPLLQAAASAPDLRFVVEMDGAGDDTAAPPVFAWADMLASDGAAAIRADAAAFARDDTACIIYTSGTGGVPKGVMLAHKALLHNCAGAEHALKELELEGAIYLSFLPLSHSYEHTAGQMFPVWCGAQIYYAEGAEALARNLTEVRPTIMTAVPRLYEALHTRILRGLDKAGGLKTALFHRTVALGRKRLTDPAGLGLWERLQDALLDRLVRNKVRAQFGGRLQAMVSGGAALNPEIGLFFEALGLHILQGYGQTETGPVVSVNLPGRARMDTVGPLLKDTHVRMADDGEILVAGDLVMQGYWRQPEATAQALVDGWVHTGDVGRFDDDGHLMITDRKKDIIVLSGGDNVAPARLEAMLVQEPEVAQAMVIGDHRPHLVALLVPDAAWLHRWAHAAGKPADLAALAADPALLRAVGEVVERINARVSLIEKVRRFAVAHEPFTIENGQMTPTMKVRRHIVREIYGKTLGGLYGG